MRLIYVISFVGILQASVPALSQPFEMVLPGTEGQRIFIMEDKYIIAGRGSEINYSNGVMITDVLPEGVAMNSRFFGLEGFNYNQTRNAGNFSFENGKFYVSLLIAEDDDGVGIPVFQQYDSTFTMLEESHIFDMVGSSADFLLHEHFDDSTVLALGHIYQSYGYNDVIMVNFDLTGNINWTYEYGCTGNCRATPTSILELNESEFIVSTNRIYNYNDGYDEYRRIFLRKVSKETGLPVWQKTYGNEGLWQEGGRLIKLQDDRIIYTWSEPRVIGFAVDQYNPYSNIYWAEIDEETGDAEIESLHGQIPNGGYYIRNIQQLPDGNVVLSGDFLEDNSFFVLKMTPDAEVEWYRRVHVYDDFINIGPSLNVFFFKDLRFHEGEYLITGRSWIHSSTDPLASGHYTVLIKLDEFGCLEPGCQYAVSDESIENDVALMVFPNPASDYVSIRSNKHPINSFQLWDLMGNELLHRELQAENEQRIDISDLSKGIYIMKISVGSQIHTRRLIIQ